MFLNPEDKTSTEFDFIKHPIQTGFHGKPSQTVLHALSFPFG